MLQGKMLFNKIKEILPYVAKFDFLFDCEFTRFFNSVCFMCILPWKNIVM